MRQLHANGDVEPLSARKDDDAQLLSAALQGERWAFTTIMSRHNRRLYRVAYAILKEDADAQDALQEAYLNAFRSLGGFNGNASLSTWLTSIVANESLARLRRRREAKDFVETTAVIASDGTDAIYNPECQAAREEIRVIVESLVEQLPKTFQAVFKLRAVEHLSIEETAARLSIPQATVKTRYHRAKRLLAAALGPDIATALRGGFPFDGERCRCLTDQVLARLIGSMPSQ